MATGRGIAVWVLPDQLLDDHPAIRHAEAIRPVGGVRVVLVESRAATRRLPYHRLRQVLHLAAGRHHAAALRERGHAVDVVAGDDTPTALRSYVARHRPGALVTMRAADHATRRWQVGRMAGDLGVPVEVVANPMFLVDRAGIDPDSLAGPGRRFVMEDFYHAVRRRFGLLLDERGEPIGGRWNFDAENRRRLPRGSAIPPVPRFEPDALTRVAIAEVEASGLGVGSARGFDLAVTRAQAESAFADFLARRLPDFGAFEDATSRVDGVLFHSTLAPQMNLGLLDPLDMARRAEAEYRRGRAPLNSVEGFIRQVVGWREWVAWQYRRQMPGLRRANAWDARRPLPRFFWDGRTDLACVRAVVERVHRSAYLHHIERLMIVGNFALLAGVEPGAVADWFLAFFADSHDWVVLPNVIGMALNADGDATATKPYVASGAYLRRMGDHCDACPFDPGRRVGPGACPFTLLYWSFLLRHEARLRANPRMALNLVGLDRIEPDERRAIAEQADRYLAQLEPWTPAPGQAPPILAPSARPERNEPKQRPLIA